MPAPADRHDQVPDVQPGWGQTVWALRKLRHWSQERLALELQTQGRSTGYGLPAERAHIKRTIQRWEAGEALPGDEYLVLLVLVFAEDAELAGGKLRAGSELEQVLSALAAAGYGRDRRRFYLNAAARVAVGHDTFTRADSTLGERPRLPAAGGPGRRRARCVGVVSGYVFKLTRESLGQTQAQLAERLAVDLNTVQGWESGRRPLPRVSVASLLGICRRLRELGAAPGLVEAIGPAAEADCVLWRLLSGEPLQPGGERPAVVELVRWPVTGDAPSWLAVSSKRTRRGPVPAGPLLSAVERRRLVGLVGPAAGGAGWGRYGWW